MAQQPPVAQGIGEGNLLFSMLALQMDFVRREALVAAIQAWVCDKRQSLGEYLERHGHISPERLHLLNALVEEHLKAHHNDPEESLAALDPALRQSVESLGAPDADATRTFMAAGMTTIAGGRYRILRPHARGGLGEVFVAEDCELHRDVALKVIQGKQADDPVSRDRFQLEAEITGRLDHPGIAPVHSMGSDAEGRPFYAMRLVQGETLKEAIARFHTAEGPGRDAGERALAFRALLTRFVAVCNTIGYAHSRGVIHRDIKPANILLGNFGETIVLDWGLAKVVGRADHAQFDAETTLRPQSGDYQMTQAGTAIGTAAFMSPEQAAGKIDQQGPPSDIYSLGATLYVLLTGRAPFEGTDHVEILHNVQTGNFAPPRQVNRDVPPPLDAICKKAMALAPADRYATAQELGAELERWLADEPVQAWPERWATRLLRWGRRRPVFALWIILSGLMYCLILAAGAMVLPYITMGASGIFMLVAPSLLAVLAFGMSLGAQLGALAGAGIGRLVGRAAPGLHCGLVVGAALGYLGTWSWFIQNWQSTLPEWATPVYFACMLCPLVGSGLGVVLGARKDRKLHGGLLGALVSVPLAVIVAAGLMIFSGPHLSDTDISRRVAYHECVTSLLSLKKHAEASRAAQEFAGAFPDDPGIAYAVGAFLARGVRIAEEDRSLGAEKRRAAAEEYGRLAVQQLRQAVTLGYRNPFRMQSDPELAPLRERADFQALLAELDRGP
jgi:tRNA A-37 threonylcarbamoyl transferase component Bud32